MLEDQSYSLHPAVKQRARAVQEEGTQRADERNWAHAEP